MDQSKYIMIHAKSKECCLLMLLDQSIVGSWKESLNEIPKVYFH